VEGWPSLAPPCNVDVWLGELGPTDPNPVIGRPFSINANDCCDDVHESVDIARAAEQHDDKPLLQGPNGLALKIHFFQGALQSATWPVRLGYLTTTLT